MTYSLWNRQYFGVSVNERFGPLWSTISETGPWRRSLRGDLRAVKRARSMLASWRKKTFGSPQRLPYMFQLQKRVHSSIRDGVSEFQKRSSGPNGLAHGP